MLVLSRFTGNQARNIDYLVACPETGEALAIDPWDAPSVLAAAQARGWVIRDILNTHEHWDHVHGNLALAEATGATIWCHHGAVAEVPGAQRGLKGGDVLRVGRQELEVLDTPGHTLTHVCLLAHGDTPRIFAGDTMFNAGVGNCFNGGDPRALYQTFKDQLWRLPDQTELHPGHDYLANNLRFTLSREPNNPYARSLLAEAEALAPGALRRMTLGEERRVNTFFRLDQEEVQAELQRALPEAPLKDEEARFLALRELRNRW